MKKTIIINIGNTIIHIEEDGYEVLTAYLNEIKQHFAKSADDFEIVIDIENRIAEMFGEILHQNQTQVITLSDVNSVISQMGRVQDFYSEDEDPIEMSSQHMVNAKKLYRDSDEAVIAGVCAGLGYYLNVETRWVRLLAFLSIFLGGSGILAYIILWIAVPRAKSRSERMEMKGESTNLFGYKRNFEEELAAFKKNMEAHGAQFSPMAKRSAGFVGEVVSAIGKVVGVLATSIFKIIAGFIVVFGFACLMALIICLPAFLGFWDNEAYQYFPLSIVDEASRNILAIAAFVILFIPILALVLFSIRVAFNKNAINKTLSFGLLIVWLIGVSIGIYHGSKLLSEFKEHAELVQTTPLSTQEKYILDVNLNRVFSKTDSINRDLYKQGFENRFVVDETDNHPFGSPRNVDISIEKSEAGKPMLIQNFGAQGKTFNMALQNAKDITYIFNQNGNKLTFSPRATIKDNTPWRAQEVNLTLKVPVGTHLLLHQNLLRYLNFYHYDCASINFYEKEYSEWVMTEDGLKCKAELEKRSDVAEPNSEGN